MKISDFDPDGVITMLGEYVQEACTALVQKKEFQDFLLSTDGNGISYKFEPRGHVIFLCTEHIRKSVVHSVSDSFISIYSDTIFIDAVPFSKMSTSEFEQDLFSLSTIHSIEVLQKLYISTFCTVLLFGEYGIHINNLLLHHFLKEYV